MSAVHEVAQSQRDLKNALEFCALDDLLGGSCAQQNVVIQMWEIVTSQCAATCSTHMVV
jgi:hypothetical protein